MPWKSGTAWKSGVVGDPHTRGHKPGKLIDDDTYDVSISKLVLRSALRSAGLDLDISDVLTGGHLQDTTTGTPTLELDLMDRDYEALNSGIFGQKVDVELDRVPFRLTTVSVTGPETLHLLFEHKIVALLREHSDPIKAARSTTTRAQFVHRMLKEIVKDFPGLIYVCPEENKAQPVTASPKTTTPPTGRSLVKTSVATKQQTHLTGGGTATAWRVRASSELASSGNGWTELSSNGNGAAAAGHVRTASGSGGWDFASLGQAFPHGTMMRITNPANGRTWTGPLTDVGDGSSFAPAIGLTPTPAAAIGWSGGEVIIQLANGQPMNVVSGFGTPVGGASVAGASSFGTGAAAVSIGGGTTQGVYEFTRGTSGTREDSWTCMQRLASEVQWRCFVSGRSSVYFVTDDDLMLAKSEYDISPNTDGLQHITLDAEVGKRTIVHKKRRQPKPSTAQVMARVERVEAPPGTVVNLDGYGVGDGKWLVGDFSRPIFTPDATLGLYTPQKPLPEPPNPTVAAAVTAGAGAGGVGVAAPTALSGSIVDRVYQAAAQITARHLPYGPGGHGQNFPAAAQASNMDCSSSTSTALWMAGIFPLPGPIVSGEFGRWGQPGQGARMTVWWTAGHVWIEFKGYPMTNFNTGQGGGPQLHSGSYGSGGYNAQRWPGT